MIQTPTVLKRSKIYFATPKRCLYPSVLKGKPSRTFRVNIVGKYLAQESNLFIHYHGSRKSLSFHDNIVNVR